LRGKASLEASEGGARGKQGVAGGRIIGAVLVITCAMFAMGPCALGQALTSDSLRGTLEQDAEKQAALTGDLPIERIARMDYALPANREEYLASQGLGAVFVVALAHDGEELPLSRVYLLEAESGKEIELEKLISVVHEDDAAGVAARVYGRHRFMGLYLVEAHYLDSRPTLVVDFAQKRAGFRVGSLIPPDYPHEGIDRLEGKVTNAFVSFVRREFPIAEEMVATIRQREAEAAATAVPTAVPTKVAVVAPGSVATRPIPQPSSSGMKQPGEIESEARDGAGWKAWYWGLGLVVTFAVYLVVGRRRLRICDECGGIHYTNEQPCAKCALDGFVREAAAREARERAEREASRQRQEEDARRREEEGRRARTEQQRSEEARRQAAERQAREEERRRGEKRRQEDQERQRRAEEEAERERASKEREAELDPYSVLGIRRNATKEEIREAWLRLTAKNHPDKVHDLDPRIHAFATERMKEINKAYEMLKDRR